MPQLVRRALKGKPSAKQRRKQPEPKLDPRLMTTAEREEAQPSPAKKQKRLSPEAKKRAHAEPKAKDGKVKVKATKAKEPAKPAKAPKDDDEELRDASDEEGADGDAFAAAASVVSLRKKATAAASAPANVREIELGDAEEEMMADADPLETAGAAARAVGRRGSSKASRQAADAGAVQEDSRTLYVGHLPRGFFEKPLRGFFAQFGAIERVRVARNPRTGHNRHYAFIRFAETGIAPIAAAAMNGYVLSGLRLKVLAVPKDKLHPGTWKVPAPKLWRRPAAAIKRHIARHNAAVRTPERAAKIAARAATKDRVRDRRLKKAGIEYEAPRFVAVTPKPKRTTFSD